MSEPTSASRRASPRVLVLGGSGFIGREVLRYLHAARPETDISALYRNQPLPDLPVEAIQGDIETLDWKQFSEQPPDTIIHLARISGRGKLSRIRAGRRGKQASCRMIAWLKTLPTPPHVVYVSGTLVYGDCGTDKVDETQPLRPIAFQREYIEAEYPFLELQEQATGIPVSIVRPPWVIGAGSWFAQFYALPALTKGVITQFGRGKNLMSLIHVRDCAAQIAEAALAGREGAVYNLHASEAISYRRFIEITSEATGADISRWSWLRLRLKYGKTVSEALSFSMHVASNKALIRDFPNVYPDAASAIRAVVDELQQKPQR